MLRSSPSVRVILSLLCIAILVMRLGGEHLHVCLDGTEPLASVHLAPDLGDGGHGNSLSQLHHDLDLSLASDALAKRLGSVLDMPALLGLAVLLLLIRVLTQPLPAYEWERPAHCIPVFGLRPPLRGPPR